MNPQLDLRDIHAAPLPTWWPPAPGWWLLAVLLFLLMGVALLLFRRRLARMRLQGRLQMEFQGIIAESDQDPALLNAQLADFFRRLVIHRGGAVDMAGTTGASWARFLAAPLATDAGVVALVDKMVEAPYQRAAPPLDVAAARRLADRWIEQVTRA